MSEINIKPRNSYWWVLPLLLSIAWLTVGVGLGFFAHPPASCTGTFSCLTLDGWGTYLSGAFAPLAFIWLVLSVRIQSAELKAQQQELQESRKVMKEQADFIGTQTRILEDQEKARERDRKVSEFQDCLSALYGVIRVRLFSSAFLIGVTSSGGDGEFNLAGGQPPPTRDECISAFMRSLGNIAGRGMREPIRIKPEFIGSVEEALTVARAAVDIAELTGGLPRYEASRLGLEQLISDLERILQTTAELVGGRKV
ncbi:hypothetical protein [Rhizobium leguminosarum]|uniref:hypothetical protein n=1 Tax=Rhizobium leguminosarum TaxID=384 RepID=UPI00162107BB|nr:hypothetical protein [Rhizobium leguminosarum]MBB4341657.1 membrane protein implicated in regulation of membrane protease activity [Rhizobium leguminosarum]MBB6294613.1 membrane protein implicated in regulation of membrane protease activity [Rhizobium leguminosarum]